MRLHIDQPVGLRCRSRQAIGSDCAEKELTGARLSGEHRTMPVAKQAVILIVEDELLIRMNAVEMIEETYEVVEAANADEAIAILERRLNITVLFTDIQMPGSMDGLKLAAAVRDRWPPILIVATSGHVKLGSGDLPQGERFLPKPYSPAEIMKTLRELVAP
jgi:CheY-like chemotaxis protein